MQNASDELLRQDDVYYTNESKIIKYNNMKKDNKKALYESIMTSVAREVKKDLNESIYKINGPWSNGTYYINNFNNTDIARLEWIDKDTYELRFIDNIPDYDEKDFYKVIKNWANKNRYIIKTQKSEWIKPTYKYEEKWVEPEYPGYEFGHYENVRREIPGHYESHLEDL